MTRIGRLRSVAAAMALATTWAVPGRALDLVEAYELARDSDPTFLAARYEKLATDKSLRLAWSELLPQAVAEASYTRSRQDIQSSDNQLFAEGRTRFPIKTYGLNLTQPLFRMTAVTGVMQARSEVRQAAAELDAAHQDLLLRVADAYLDVLAAADELSLRGAERAALERRSELAERRRESGLGIVSDVYEAGARLALAEADEVVASFALRDAHQALAEITGELREDLKVLGDDAPLASPEPMDPEVWVRQALAANPALEAAKHAAEVAEREVARQRSAHLPVLDFTANLDNRDTDGSLFGGGSQVETSDYGVKVTFPIFSGGAALFGTQRAVDLAKRERQLLVQAERALVRDTRAAFQAVDSVARRVRALRRTAEVQELAVTSRQKAVRAGVDTTINVLNAEREYFAARRDYAAGRYEYLRSVLALEQSAGALGVEDLAQIDTWMAEPAAAAPPADLEGGRAP